MSTCSHNPGTDLVVTKRKFRTLEALLDELSARFQPTCIQRLYDLGTGGYVDSLENLE